MREGGDAAQLVKGVEMTHGQILDVLAKEGVEVIDPVGEPFDPGSTRRVGQRDDASVADHTVVDGLPARVPRWVAAWSGPRAWSWP